MQKPWYSSQTIIASLVGGVVALASAFHLNLSDLAPQITDALGQLVNALLTVISVGAAIQGRIKADQNHAIELALTKAQIASSSASASTPLVNAPANQSTRPLTETYQPSGNNTAAPKVIPVLTSGVALPDPIVPKVFQPIEPNAETTKIHPIAKISLALIGTIGLLGLTGCSTTAPTTTGSTTAPTPTTTADQAATLIENNLGLIRTASAVATGLVLDYGVKDTGHRTRLANEIYSSANALYSLSTGSIPTVAQVEASITSFGGDDADAQYASYASALGSLYGSYINGLSGNSKAAIDLLTAIGEGAQDGAKAYTSVPTTTSATAATPAAAASK